MESIDYDYYLKMPLTVGWLQTHVSQGYDLIRPLNFYNPLFAICANVYISKPIFEWLIDSGYGPELIDNGGLPLSRLFNNPVLDIELFESIIKYIGDYDLWTFICE